MTLLSYSGRRAQRIVFFWVAGLSIQLVLLPSTAAFSPLLTTSYSRKEISFREIRAGNTDGEQSSSQLEDENISLGTSTAFSDAAELDDNGIRPCYWKSPDGMCRMENGEYMPVKGEWKQRVQLKDLKVGQKLIGEKISNADLLQAKTGPKIFFECGVGRIDSRGNWQMVSGMLRVAKSFAKPSVVRKKVQKLSGRPLELFVHRIFLENGRLEVKLSLDEVLDETKNAAPKIPASSLKVGQELVGKVVALKPFGCIVDVGANRNGMLHIQRVADLFGKYIDKEQGLQEAGLERGATIKVAVHSNEKRKLILDFTQETKTIAAQEAEARRREEEEQEEDADEVAAVEAVAGNGQISEEEAAAWAAYANDSYESEDEEDDDDDYDEDAEIEDMLGIGSY